MSNERSVDVHSRQLYTITVTCTKLYLNYCIMSMYIYLYISINEGCPPETIIGGGGGTIKKVFGALFIYTSDATVIHHPPHPPSPDIHVPCALIVHSKSECMTRCRVPVMGPGYRTC